MSTTAHVYPFSTPHSIHTNAVTPDLVSPASAHPFYASSHPTSINGVFTTSLPTKRRKRKPFLTRLTNRLLLTLSLLLDHLPALCDLALRLLGPALVLLQWCIFLGMHYLYYYHIVPTLHLNPYTQPHALITLLGYTLYFTIMYHHCRAVFTQPGRLPADSVVPVDIEAVLEAEKWSYRKGLTFTRHCRTCLRKKPPRTHHW